ncbi:polyprenyl synthetase domain-containing protein [Hirsutella rhossiliensis]|uniref:Polyprenyl synthetase domain-containing protein n=1 Tax=Hirsutella rhossiliensis TaxID=111463 RepID=A0A9P8MRC9_9HYPO|nr:polyprenyl synthetase domain-containing protein [Hirsutella rhossiliensis]KAH0960443.1 polyprenyl synthetase domain-containing protein [Hirsutella rhossiliensis]
MDYVSIVLEELKILYIGQSLDLYWTCNLVCPSVGEHLKSVDNKTGGIFRMLLRLMEATSLSTNNPDLRCLIILLGRHFGIRDDYQNLCSNDYARQKGFCEDLDEGKYSLPIIHALHSLSEDQGMVLRNMLAQRRVNGKSSLEHKQLILQLMQQSGSLNYTLAALRQLQSEIDKEVEAIELLSGFRNDGLRALLYKLYV